MVCTGRKVDANGTTTPMGLALATMSVDHDDGDHAHDWWFRYRLHRVPSFATFQCPIWRRWNVECLAWRHLVGEWPPDGNGCLGCDRSRGVGKTGRALYSPISKSGDETRNSVKGWTRTAMTLPAPGTQPRNRKIRKNYRRMALFQSIKLHDKGRFASNVAFIKKRA